MSKESLTALPCPGCGTPIQHMVFHIPHCPNNNNSPFITIAQQKGVGRSKATATALT